MTYFCWWRVGFPTVPDLPGQSRNWSPVRNPGWIIPGTQNVLEFEKKVTGQFTAFALLLQVASLHRTQRSAPPSVIYAPVNNTYPEIVISHMNSAWSKKWNRMAVNLVNAELQVRLNITDLELISQISFIWAQWKGTDESSRERNNILFGKKRRLFAASTNF